MRYLRKFKVFENLGDIFEFDIDDITDSNLEEKDELETRWKNGEKIMSDGSLSGNIDEYEKGYKIMAEVLKKIGFSEEDVDKWEENKSNSFDNY